MTKKIPKYRWLIVEKLGFCLTISLNRPEAGNAMNALMAKELIDVFEIISDNQDIAAIILKGVGKHFSAGGDLKDMIDCLGEPTAGKEDPLYRVNRRFGDLLMTVDKAPQVVVSLVHGAARGGGLGLACVSDIVVGLNSSTYAMPETGFGLPGAQIIPFVCQRLGKSYTRQLIVTGQAINGEEAYRVGLVTHLCSDIDTAKNVLEEILDQIKGRSPEAISQSKRLIQNVNKKALTSILDDGAQTVASMSRYGDGAEGLEAFIQKRKPNWANRNT